MKEYLAPRFKEARSERHLTKAEFAKALMLDVRSYNDIEQGYVHIRRDEGDGS